MITIYCSYTATAGEIAVITAFKHRITISSILGIEVYSILYQFKSDSKFFQLWYHWFVATSLCLLFTIKVIYFIKPNMVATYQLYNVVAINQPCGQALNHSDY